MCLPVLLVLQIVLACRTRSTAAAPDGQPRDGEAEEYIDEEEDATPAAAAGGGDASGRNSNADEQPAVALTVTPAAAAGGTSPAQIDVHV